MSSLTTKTDTKPLVILVTGATTGFGLLTARSLAKAGHIVYAGQLACESDPDSQSHGYREAVEFARENDVMLKPIQIDVTSEESIDACIAKIVKEEGRIDSVVFNAGRFAHSPKNQPTTISICLLLLPFQASCCTYTPRFIPVILAYDEAFSILFHFTILTTFLC